MSEQETFYPISGQHWREWLQENHDKKQSIWLVCFKMKAKKPTISWSDAVDEALCFGWIDSTRRSVDDERFMQYFGRRKPSSTWSKVNKEKVEQLIEAGRMTKAGIACIEIAKQNGSWSILDEVEEVTIPDDLEAAFEKYPGSKKFFMSLSRSVRKRMLHWIVMAKREETRQKRITEVVGCTGQGIRPMRFI
ncbi:MAG: YdeI/OmpD-associated family protein [Flavobacteriales bacterium]|nr:YdeI/OmpD-associated family protein [Flavobacteriales bacterium]